MSKTHLATSVFTIAAAFILAPTSAFAQTSALNGTWQAKETAKQKSARLQAVQTATAKLSFFIRGRARSKLTKATAPTPRVVIAIAGGKVTLGANAHRMTLQLGAAPVEVKGERGKAKLSAKLSGSKLVVVARTSKATRTTTYSIKGSQLLVDVEMKSAKLGAPLRYRTSYTRARNSFRRNVSAGFARLGRVSRRETPSDATSWLVSRVLRVGWTRDVGKDITSCLVSLVSSRELLE